jgi:nicotinamidase-related amidase
MDARQTALILVGYQNDYFAPSGVLRGVFDDPARVDRVLARSLDFIRAVAKTPMAIISTPIVLSPTYRALASSVGILDSIKQAGAFREGTAGAQTIAQLLEFGERISYVTGKIGFNAFSNTSLEEELQRRGIRNALVAGMVTSLCIDSTGRAAYERGLGVTVLSDCTSGRTAAEHEFYCESIFPLYARALTSEQVLQELQAVPA